MHTLWRIMLLTAVTLTTFITGSASADQGAGFSISMVQNENQQQPASYYDLRLVPGQSTVLQFKINNTSDEDGTYEVTLNTVSTSDYMSYNYDEPDVNQTFVPNNLQFKQLAPTANQKVDVPAQTEKVVDIPITMPADAFAGKVYGALSVTRQVRADEQNKSGITSQFAYVRSVIISESDEEIEPKLTFGQPNSTTDKNGQLQVKLPITYPTPLLVSEVTTRAVIKDEKGNVIVDSTTKNHNIAPQSRFNYTINLDSKKFKTGKYTLDLNVETANGRKWSTQNKTFTITKKVAATAKKYEQGKPKSFTINPWYIIAVLLAVVAGLLVVLFARRKKAE